ncbi:MAG TPA: precorrin-2 C(20)-methyltransferase [Gemmataceae bacterium]|jgi:precorrin-2/cobalt-factor-2 C20-methyltransferase|nr:precorrin-2 C(20)-methyltransferase [Gemmataceae bacterium]
MNAVGKFYGIGVGPGDPELLTRKAARILAEVDWIFLPAQASGAPGLAARIVADLNLDPARFRPVKLRMSRSRDTDLEAYDRAADEILAELRRGQSAAWITEGDPLFYSTFVHVWSALRSRDPELSVEIVPGITSIGAAAARVGVSVATLEERVAVVPAAYGLHHLPQLLEKFSTVFLLKVHNVFGELLDRLASLSAPTQTFYVENVGTTEERIVRDLTSLRGERLPYFSLVILHREEVLA